MFWNRLSSTLIITLFSIHLSVKLLIESCYQVVAAGLDRATKLKCWYVGVTLKNQLSPESLSETV